MILYEGIASVTDRSAPNPFDHYKILGSVVELLVQTRMAGKSGELKAAHRLQRAVGKSGMRPLPRSRWIKISVRARSFCCENATLIGGCVILKAGMGPCQTSDSIASGSRRPLMPAFRLFQFQELGGWSAATHRLRHCVHN